MEDLDLECVASFLVLVEESHFGRAAARLFVSPTALSRRLQKLERQVGVRLYERDAVGAAGPTEAGQDFAVAGVRLLQQAAVARRSAVAAARRSPTAAVPRCTGGPAR